MISSFGMNRPGLSAPRRRLTPRVARRRIERLFAWPKSFRWLVTRYERQAVNVLAFAQLGCIVIPVASLRDSFQPFVQAEPPASGSLEVRCWTDSLKLEG